MLQPTRISVALTTPTPPPTGGGTWPYRAEQRVEIRLDAAGRATSATAQSSIHDPYQDETPPDYVVPGSDQAWQRTLTPTAGGVVDDLTAQVAALDTGALVATPPHLTDAERAVLQLSFSSRPIGIDHLRPFEGFDGAWHVRVQSSLDLLAQPALAPVIDAARAVIDAARSTPAA